MIQRRCCILQILRTFCVSRMWRSWLRQMNTKWSKRSKYAQSCVPASVDCVHRKRMPIILLSIPTCFLSTCLRAVRWEKEKKVSTFQYWYIVFTSSRVDCGTRSRFDEWRKAFRLCFCRWKSDPWSGESRREQRLHVHRQSSLQVSGQVENGSGTGNSYPGKCFAWGRREDVGE